MFFTLRFITYPTKSTWCFVHFDLYTVFLQKWLVASTQFILDCCFFFLSNVYALNSQFSFWNTISITLQVLCRYCKTPSHQWPRHECLPRRTVTSALCWFQHAECTQWNILLCQQIQWGGEKLLSSESWGWGE